MSDVAKQLIIPIPASSGVSTEQWTLAPVEYAVSVYEYDDNEGYFLWLLHSVGAFRDSVPWYEGAYHSIKTEEPIYVRGTISSGVPVVSSPEYDYWAALLAVAPDMETSPGQVLASYPATFYGFSAEPAPVRFWTNLVRTNEII